MPVAATHVGGRCLELTCGPDRQIARARRPRPRPCVGGDRRRPDGIRDPEVLRLRQETGEVLGGEAGWVLDDDQAPVHARGDLQRERPLAPLLRCSVDEGVPVLDAHQRREDPVAPSPGRDDQPSAAVGRRHRQGVLDLDAAATCREQGARLLDEDRETRRVRHAYPAVVQRDRLVIEHVPTPRIRLVSAASLKNCFYLCPSTAETSRLRRGDNPPSTSFRDESDSGCLVG